MEQNKVTLNELLEQVNREITRVMPDGNLIYIEFDNLKKADWCNGLA